MFFNSMVLVLDRLYVHRIRPVAGKDANALNEVELICDSLMNSGRVFRGNKVLEYIADQSAIGLEIGDQIRRTAADFAKLSTAFFAVLEGRFVAA